MIKKIKAIIAVAALSGTVGANVQAAEVTVEKGDTLWGISQEHQTTVDNIQKWNHLSTDLIHPGDVLTIATEKHHLIQKGDTLWDVAIEYGVTVNQIKEWNKLNTDLIHPGLNLVIYDGLTNNKVNNAGSVKTANSNNEKGTGETSPQPAAASESKQPTTNTANNTKETATNDLGTEKEITVNATAYTASCEGCSGTTFTGVDLNANPDSKVIAVDPSVIPLGSKVYVEGYGVATAADIGGAIKGNRIDVFIPKEQDALNWGRKKITVKILN